MKRKKSISLNEAHKKITQPQNCIEFIDFHKFKTKLIKLNSQLNFSWLFKGLIVNLFLSHLELKRLDKLVIDLNLNNYFF